MSRLDRVHRPLGLTLAIIAIATLYGLLPLGEVYFLHRLELTADEANILGGVDISVWTWLEGLVGGLILLLCILAWWGRPAWVRFVLMAAIVGLTLLNLYRVAQTWTTAADPVFGGQTESVLRGFLRCQVPGLIVVPLYVLWYLNRAPARAFYRRVPLAALSRPLETAAPGNEDSGGTGRVELQPPGPGH